MGPLLSRAKRDRRADRSGFGLSSTCASINVVQSPGVRSPGLMKIDCEAFGKFFDGTPGKSWDDYASRLKNAAAGEVDERGYSLADEFEGVAEGQPGGPPMPGAAAQLLKAQAAASKTTTEGSIQHAYDDNASQRTD